MRVSNTAELRSVLVDSLLKVRDGKISREEVRNTVDLSREIMRTARADMDNFRLQLKLGLVNEKSNKSVEPFALTQG